MLSSIGAHGEELLRSFWSNAANSSEGMLVLLNELGRCVGAGETKERLFGLLSEITKTEAAGNLACRLSTLAGFAEGLRTRGLGGGEHSPLLSLLAENPGPAVDISDPVRRSQ